MTFKPLLCLTWAVTQAIVIVSIWGAVPVEVRAPVLFGYALATATWLSWTLGGWMSERADPLNGVNHGNE
jgi:hypothetical protein